MRYENRSFFITPFLYQQKVSKSLQSARCSIDYKDNSTENAFLYLRDRKTKLSTRILQWEDKDQCDKIMVSQDLGNQCPDLWEVFGFIIGRTAALAGILDAGIRRFAISLN